MAEQTSELKAVLERLERADCRLWRKPSCRWTYHPERRSARPRRGDGYATAISATQAGSSNFALLTRSPTGAAVIAAAG
jgi:hypothetical protein